MNTPSQAHALHEPKREHPERLSVQVEFDNEPAYWVDTASLDDECATVPPHRGRAFASELADRYNAHEELLEALQALHDECPEDHMDPSRTEALHKAAALLLKYTKL